MTATGIERNDDAAVTSSSDHVRTNGTATVSVNEQQGWSQEKILTGTMYERLCQPIILLVSAGLNIPPFVFGMMSIQVWCEYYALWMIINGIICLLNIAAVIYSIVKLRQKMLQDHISRTAHLELQIERQIRRQSQHRQSGSSAVGDISSNSERENRTVDVDVEHGGDEISGTSRAGTSSAELLGEKEETEDARDHSATVDRQGGMTTGISSSLRLIQSNASAFQERVRSRRTQSSNRLRHLICYNAQISTYAIVFIFWVFWLASGAQIERRENDGSNASELENCEDYHRNLVTTSLTLGYAYVAVLVTSILLSFCDRK